MKKIVFLLILVTFLVCACKKKYICNCTINEERRGFVYYTYSEKKYKEKNKKDALTKCESELIVSVSPTSFTCIIK